MHNSLTGTSGYGNVRMTFPGGRKLKTSHTRISGFLSFIMILSAIVFTCCPKRPITEAEDVNRKLADIRNDCASISVSKDLSDLQPDIDAMNALYEKGRAKKTTRKALEILPRLVSIQSKIDDDTRSFDKRAGEERASAERSLREAEDEGAVTHAGELYGEARELLQKGDQLLSRQDCTYDDAIEMYRKSSSRSALAKEEALVEKERIAQEEEERRQREAMKKEEPLPKEETREWTVGRGEALWKISAHIEVYNDPFLWPLIFWANRSQIKRPDIIYEGQKLKIPRDLKKEEIDLALKRARSGEISGSENSLNGQ